MTFINSSIASLHAAGKGIHLVLWLFCLVTGAAFVTIRKACYIAHALGVVAGEWYYTRGGKEMIAEELAPTVAALKAAYAWVKTDGKTIVVKGTKKVSAIARTAYARLEAEEQFVFSVIANVSA